MTDILPQTDVPEEMGPEETSVEEADEKKSKKKKKRRIKQKFRLTGISNRPIRRINRQRIKKT